MKKFIITTALSLSGVFALVALALGITTYSSSYTREYVATGICSCLRDSSRIIDGSIIFTPAPGHTWSGGDVGPMVVTESGNRYWPEDTRSNCASERAQGDAFVAAFPWLALILFTWLIAGIILLSSLPDEHRPA